ncbi:MAG: phage major capsid protein [Clostridia bacterium]|nr:phage major capsid protein [Clostridia bacterium]
MAVTLTNADSALKSYYLEAVSEQLDNYVNPFLAQIKKTSDNVWGKEVKQLAIYGVNGGVGAGTEDGALPKASGNNYIQFTSSLKNLYGNVEISDKAIRASENNSGAFVSLLNSEMDGLVKASAFNLGRMIFGDGSGVLAQISEAEGNNVFAVDDVTFLMEGMVIDLYDSDLLPVEDAEGRRIVYVDRVEKTVKIDGPVLMVADIPEDACIVMHGSYNNELTGLAAIFDSDVTSLYGVNKAQNPWINPKIAEDVGDITEGAIQTMLDDIEEAGGSSADLIITSFGVRRALINLFSANKRVVNTVDLAGGYKALSYNGIPIVADRFCQKNTMYVLNTKDFALHQLCDWQWLTGDDGKVLRQIPGKPVYTATLVKYAELMCSRPYAQGVLKGITEA